MDDRLGETKNESGRTMPPPSSVLEGQVAEFDTLYREERQFMLAMHPK